MSTNKDKLQELLEARAIADQELEKMRTPVTILFSDIKGSTAYFEKKGDLEGMAMINRHNGVLFPVIEGEGGRIVKTIGDAIMACFEDQVAAVKAAVGMQRALEEDRKGREEIEQIHIRVGLHHGLGLLKEGDVFGDVVNAASRVQHQAETEQILITDALLDAARSAGFECARMGRAELRGKDEPIDVYAVAWSASATQQLIQEVEAQYEKKFKDMKRKEDQLEEEFENARDQWRVERRSLNTKIEQLEETATRARQSARAQVSDDLQSEIRFQLEEAIRTRQQLEQDIMSANQRFEAERNNLKAEIASMQGRIVEAMERSNNPTRTAMAIREQVETRVAEAKQEWQLQWDGERKRLTVEIERLKKMSSVSATSEKKEAARRALLEKLGKLPSGSAGAAGKTAEQWETDYENAKIEWETERDQLHLKLKKLELELQRSADSMRSEVFQEMRNQYEPKLADANRDRYRLEQEIQALTGELATERQRLNARVEQLEQAIPEAQESARKQVSAELQSQFDARLEEANRLRSRLERRQQDATDEWEAERRRAKKQIATLEEQLKEAKETAYKLMKGRPVPAE
ncbi:MAG TPA: adenylate/guanylate cyclase domain-containing protein [Terriglobia bacterium]|nr:adenylate/guanylate cyclase domain-containing protein [Terriglobia bacterium]